MVTDFSYSWLSEAKLYAFMQYTITKYTFWVGNMNGTLTDTVDQVLGAAEMYMLVGGSRPSKPPAPSR